MCSRLWFGMLLAWLVVSAGCTSVVVSDRPGVGSDKSMFAWLVAQADARARQPYVAPDETLPPKLEKLDYDSYRKILYQWNKTLWADSAEPYKLQFFHRGFLHRQRIAVNLITDAAVEPLTFSPALFEYMPEIRAALEPDTLPTDLGFAGIKVLYPLNEPGKLDELITFLDASYFRALAKGQFYGISARGVAIDTVTDHPEEFPCFRSYWIRKPVAGDDHIAIFALLDGPSVSGAYQFVLRPGSTTTLDIHAHLVFRRDIAKLGLAPLTSMFLNGESHPGQFDAHRPELHDSDTLLVAMPDGQWLNRPLTNPDKVTITDLPADHPLGFGLMQLDRRFAHYNDPEAHYDLRPSYWVEPLGDWGKGDIQLVELPTKNEFADNVVAFWKPRQAIRAGDVRDLQYRLHVTSADPQSSGQGLWRRP